MDGTAQCVGLGERGKSSAPKSTMDHCGLLQLTENEDDTMTSINLSCVLVFSFSVRCSSNVKDCTVLSTVLWSSLLFGRIGGYQTLFTLRAAGAH